MSSNEEDCSSDNDEDYVPDASEANNESDVAENEESPKEQVIEDNMVVKIEHKDKVDEFWNSIQAKRKNSSSKSCQQIKKVKNISETINKDDTKQIKNFTSPISLKPDMVTITKLYDFAGEEIKVTKEVKKNSKEALDHSKEQKSSNFTLNDHSLNKVNINKKRSGGGIGNILGKLGKKPKLSTLEKSKLDWDNFKQENDIQDELNTYNKGKQGYLEKVSFLERTEIRQFNHEKDVRLSKCSRR